MRRESMSLNFSGSFSESPRCQSDQAKDEKQERVRFRHCDNCQRFNPINKAELGRLAGPEATKQEAEAVPSADGCGIEEIPGVPDHGGETQEVERHGAAGKGGVAIDRQLVELGDVQARETEPQIATALEIAVDGEFA